MKKKYSITIAAVLLGTACSSGETATDASDTNPSTSGPVGTNTVDTGRTSQTGLNDGPTTTTPSPTTGSDGTGGEITVVSTGESNNGSETITHGQEPGGTTTPTVSSDSAETSGETTEDDSDVVDTGADGQFSFFVTSYHHMSLLAGDEDGFGGDLRYNGATTGLEGADAICQEIGRRVGFGHRSWKAYLSTSTVNAIDRIGSGPWYDFVGAKVADSPQDLIDGANRQPGGCCEEGTYDEMGLFHDGSTDQNNDGIDDDDHDTLTATLEDGTYAGFSCEDWTSTTATSAGSGGGGGRGGIMLGHSWPARSGEHWATSHAGHQCAAGTNFIQDGSGDASTVGGGGGYGGIYCFALAE